MENTNGINELVAQFMAVMVIFLPVLFGAIEFLKAKLGLEGRKVEIISMVLFVVFGALVVVGFYFPEYGTEIAAIVLFLLMCALAPSGYYKFVNARTSKIER